MGRGRLAFAILAVVSDLFSAHGDPAVPQRGLAAVRDRAVKTLRACTVPKGAYGLKCPFVAPGGYGACWWQLDSTSALEGLKWVDFPFAERSILDFANVQKPDGRIPLYGPDVIGKSPHHPKQSEGASSLPSIFRSGHDIALMSGKPETVKGVYAICRRYLDWWRRCRIDAKTGLVSSLFEKTFPPYLGHAGEWSGVDTNVEVARGAILTAELADRLGKLDEAEDLRRFAVEIYAAVERLLWNEKAGLFCPIDLRSGVFGAASPAGFGMFFDPKLPRNRRERMLKELKGPRFGWQTYPLTSVARDDPSFTVTRGDKYQFNPSWSGMVWSLIVIRVVEALAFCGETETSDALRDRFLAMIEHTGEFREFYDPNDGSGHGARDYAWTASHYLQLCHVPAGGAARNGDFGVNGAYYADWESRGGTIKVTHGRLGANDFRGGGHQQGISCNDDFIFFGASAAVGKLDWQGNPVRVKQVPAHMGDVAWYKGRLYATWARHEGKKEKKNLVAVFDENLDPVAEHEVPGVAGIDGIAVLDDVIYFGAGAEEGRNFHRKNRIGRMTLDFRFLGWTEIDIGVDVNYGVQNMVAADGKVYCFFYTHLGDRKGSPVTCGIFDRDLKLLATKRAYSGQGIAVAPKRFQTVPGKTVFLKGGSSSPKKGTEPAPDFVRLRYGLYTLRD